MEDLIVLKNEIEWKIEEQPDHSHFDITVVTVGSLNRLFILPIFASRWNGYLNSISFISRPIVFSIHLQENQTSLFESFLQQPENAILREPRIRFVAYICKEGSFFSTNYPINILRNLGIMNVKTSFMIVLDMDMWLSSMILMILQLMNRRFIWIASSITSGYSTWYQNSYCDTSILSYWMDNSEWYIRRTST